MAVYPRSSDASAADDGGVPTQPSFPLLEENVLKYWQASDTFRASIARRVDAPEFVFYDGPPFANGLPHYGHLLTGYVKDVVPRYQTMRGFRVDRRFGWDCHGLPAEVEAERQLGISGKSDIVTMGIDKFNAACRESVLQYTSEWQDYVSRQARWVDFGNDYKTLNLDYMESVMWAFKQLHDKGLVYQGFKVLPYCWRCETPLSNHELRMDDDVYQERQDPSVTVRFRLETGEWLLAWTTTPWTLPSNLAVAVGAGIRYAVVERDFERYILAEERLSHYQNELADAVRVDTVTGSELAGRRYEPLFPYLADTPGVDLGRAFRVILSPDVTTEDGTGVVHMAPAYGEADAEACNAAGIPTVLTVDDQGRFTSLVPDFEGQHVFDANKAIIARLRADGSLVRAETYAHSYPHCWRCRNPLIYKAMSSWFVEVTKFRDRMVELNQEITWVPEHIKDGQFGKWLSNARDWSISRNRFWGSPIPVWMSDDPAYPRVDVYGSLDELERDFGVRPADLHRPYIDSLTRVNPDDPTGQSVMRRVPEVLDCWFESGSMPFAQVHYPFENREWFDSHYPGDFIVEYIGQTRGWFYLLHVLATALFDRPSFRTCLSHGIVLGDDGQKMSKSLRNYPDVNEVFDTYGSDAMRWFLMSSPVLRGGNLIVTEQGIRDAVRQAILPLWNSYYFFALYANAESYTARFSHSPGHVLDRYILAKTSALVSSLADELDEYDIAAACQAVREHLELLTNWYIRRSRSRFWQGDTDALDTLYTVLETVCRAAAPLLPLTTEAVWRGLTGGSSVHLDDWPDVSSWPSDPGLADAMDLVRLVCSSALGLRKARQLRVRLPLASLTVAHPAAQSLAPFTDIIRDELNVKEVLLDTDPASLGTFELAVNPRVLGPRLGGKVQEVIRAVKAGDWTSGPDEVVTAAGVELQPGEYELRLSVAGAAGATAALPGGVGLVALDTVLTPALEAEGTARDVVRSVQQARRDAGLDVSDRICLVIAADPATLEAVSAHAEFVKAETLAADLELKPASTLEITVTPKVLSFSYRTRTGCSSETCHLGGGMFNSARREQVLVQETPSGRPGRDGHCCPDRDGFRERGKYPVVYRPVASHDRAGHDRAWQRRRQPLWRGRRAAHHRRPVRRKRPGQQLQQQGERPGHRHHDRRGNPVRRALAVRSCAQVPSRLPRRGGPDHRADRAAQRLGHRRLAAHYRRQDQRGRLPPRAGQPRCRPLGMGWWRHQRPVGHGLGRQRQQGGAVRDQRAQRHGRGRRQDRLRRHGLAAQRAHPVLRQAVHHLADDHRFRLPRGAELRRAGPRSDRRRLQQQRHPVRRQHGGERGLRHPRGAHPRHVSRQRLQARFQRKAERAARPGCRAQR